MEKYGKLDQKDLCLLKELQQNAKQTNAQLSEKIGIPVTTVHNRIKRLEKLGIVKKYTVSIDNEKLGKPMKAYVLVSINYMLSSGIKVNQEDVAQEIKDIPEVESVKVMTGVNDILVKIKSKDIQELNEFVVKQLRKIDGIDKTQTMVVLSEF